MSRHALNIGMISNHPEHIRTLGYLLEHYSHHHLAWTASSWSETRRLNTERPVDLVLIDISDALFDPVELTRNTATYIKTEILLVTGSDHYDPALIFNGMGAGALDVLRIPEQSLLEDPEEIRQLTGKLDSVDKLLYRSRKREGKLPTQKPGSVPGDHSRLVTIGASTGGPKALASILAGIPASCPASMVVVQHVDTRFSHNLAVWLNDQTELVVRIARPGDRPVPGLVLLAGTNDHLVMKQNGTLDYTTVPTDYVYRPSVDVLFKSAAAYWPGTLMGVLLTGMGRDGADGLLAIRNRGMNTIVQNEKTCAVYGMPAAAVSLNAARKVLAPEDISREIIKVFTDRGHSKSRSSL